MSAQTHTPAPETAPVSGYPLPPTEKQIRYARQIALRTSHVLPWDTLQSRALLSQWITGHAALPANTPKPSERPATSRQVAFAERLAMRKHTNVPRECFQSAQIMSRWIDSLA